MVKELNDNEIKNASGSYDSMIHVETYKALGYTLHDFNDTCDSFVPCDKATNSGTDFEHCCGNCLYGAYIVEYPVQFYRYLPSDPGDMACMIKK